MLVCSVSLRAPRPAIAADVAETATAADATATGNVVFATLVDDPASVGAVVDAFLGQIMLEAASAAATVNAGFIATRLITEAATAADVLSAFMPTAAAVTEAATAIDVPDAGVTSAPVTWDAATVTAVTLSGGNLVATNTGTTSANQGAKVVSTSGKTSGKYYYEITITTKATGANCGLGIGTTASTYTAIGTNATTGAVLYLSGGIWANGANSGSSLASRSTGDVIGVAVDLANRKIWFRKVNGTPTNWNGSGTADPATNVGGVTVPAGTMIPFCVFGGTSGSTGNVLTANFGASAFTAAVPSGFTTGWPI